jgi:CRP-like cAMP-binding protein
MLDGLQRYISRYVELSKEEFAVMAGMLNVRNFERRQQLVRLGEKEEYLNFLVSGVARKFFMKGKEEIIIQIAREGDVITASTSFLSGEPSSYIVETIEACTFLSISRVRMEELYAKYPRIERLGRLVITDFCLQKEEWELGMIRLEAKERFLQFVEGNPDLIRRVPQKYLASYLNMKPETFSRMKHLLKKGPVREKSTA